MYLNYHVLSCSFAATPQNKIRQKYFERNVKQSVVIGVNDGGFLSIVQAGVEPALPLWRLSVTPPTVLTSRWSKVFSLLVFRLSKILAWHRSYESFGAY